MTVRSLGTRLLALSLVLASITCGDNPAAPEPRPAALVQVSGDHQTSPINQPLAEPIVVRVDDSQGRPLPGVTVSWTVTDVGSVSQSTVTSGDAGLAAVQWVLGGTAGVQTTTARVPDLPPVIFTATAEAGTPPQLTVVTQPSSAAENAVPFSRQPVVLVEDGNGHPVGAGIPVTVSLPGATLTGTKTAESNGSGVVEFTDLAIIGAGGTYSLTFSAPNAADVQSESITLSPTPANLGHWSAPFDWPIVAVHTMLLPDGRVLAIGRNGRPEVWDPATNTFTTVAAPARLFCSGHALLPDGRVFVAGGHISDGRGLSNITYFSATDNAWTSGTPMARGRWYPTTTVMGNGDVVITAGTDEDSAVVTVPEVWSNGTIRQLTGAEQPLPWYPRAFLAPDGSLYIAGPTVATRFLSVSGSGSWRRGPAHLYPVGRNYGGAVMYEDGKILYAGGAFTTNTAEVIDLNQSSPVWSWTGSMAYARRHLNLTALPTGEVLATGGVAGTDFNDISTGVHAAEIWSPQTGQWSTLASNAITRGYHGTSLLLPDGRVLNAGSGEGAGAPDERNAELFSPPYLLRGSRPVITSAPAEVRYGDQFRILTPEAPQIAKVSLIRLGAVTHAFDENQRYQRLSFTGDDAGLTVTAPSSSNRAPPGHYMLFILDGNDVPSIAKIIRVF